MKSLTIQSRIHDYDVFFPTDRGFIQELVNDHNAVFIIDTVILDLYASLFNGIKKERLMTINAVENVKNFKQVFQVYKFLANRNSKKNLHLVSVGGGIIQDITGFAASTLYRGIKWTFIPTTLLAQADSCVGSKTSLNFEDYKNLVGTFYPPHQVYISDIFVGSLSEEELHSGTGEIVKFLLLDDINPIDIDLIKETVTQANNSRQFSTAISLSLAVKQSYIKQDEFDLGKRNLFNYGHCFGHAIEYATGYQVPHGIAVIYGMILANLVAVKRGYISNNYATLLYEKLFRPYLSVELDKSGLDVQMIISALKKDKKRVGKDMTLILPSSEKIEAMKVTDLKEQEVVDALEVFKTIRGVS